MLNHISPSSLRVFERDREEFFLFYLATHRLARSEHGQAAAIGSAFDARVKSALCQALFGNACSDTLRFEALFESQVGESHRDWALAASQYLFDAYVQSGRYTELLYVLQQADGPPQLEGRISSELVGSDGVTIIPTYGLPDLTFRSRSGFIVVHDWKVKGFCSAHAKSPTKLYVMCRDGYSPELTGHKATRGNGKPHKNAVLTTVDDLVVHEGFMEDADTYYADQLAMYLWATGEQPAHSNHVVQIDELVCKPVQELITDSSSGVDDDCEITPTNYPLVRVATIAARVSNSYQLQLVERLTRMWQIVQSGHIFDDLPREASDRKCAELNERMATQSRQGDAVDAEFADYLRSKFRFAG